MSGNLGDVKTTRVQNAFDKALDTSRLTKKANEAIDSFAKLVDEINNIQKNSIGTTKKGEVSTIANEMNNSSVMVTKMLAAQVQALHQIIYTEPQGQQEAIS